MSSPTTLSEMLATPLTQALRRALMRMKDERASDDLLFLERWELSPTPGTANALRAAQIRRANPELAAAIRAELKSRR
jgi:hypothetical protein